MEKNEIYQVSIERWSSEGDGICRVDGMAVFVKGAVPGDLCRIRILKVMKNYAFARLEEVLDASANRAISSCPVFGKCGGCTFQHIQYAEELRMKQERVEDALQRIGGLNIAVSKIVGSDQQHSYRNKAIYQVSEQNGVPTFGFYRRGTHDVISTDRCVIETPDADHIMLWLKNFTEENQIKIYDEKTGQGTLRHLFIRSASDGTMQLCLVSAEKQIPHQDQMAQSLVQQFPNLASIILLYNPEKGNVAMTGKMSVLHGSKYLNDTLCGLKFQISPLSFYQINHAQTEKLYQTALDFAALKPDETALDLYCGIGTITLCLAAKAKHVIGAEIVQDAIEDAKRNAEQNQIHNAEFICADAAEAANQILKRNLKIDVITVDPPRKGLSPEAIDAIYKIHPSRIVYVSCDPATLARDLKLLSTNYQVTQVQPVDMFPRTEHVECVIMMTNSGSKGK